MAHLCDPSLRRANLSALEMSIALIIKRHVYFTYFTSGLCRATLSQRGICHSDVSVRLSICLSQVGVLLKLLNVGSRKQCPVIAQGV